MYLRKMRPRTTCLYSAASMLLRSLSAVSQSLASKPRGAPLPLVFPLDLAIRPLACRPGTIVRLQLFSLHPDLELMSYFTTDNRSLAQSRVDIQDVQVAVG